MRICLCLGTANLAVFGDFFGKDLVPSIGVDWLLDNPRLVTYSRFDIRLGIQQGTAQHGFLELVVQ